MPHSLETQEIDYKDTGKFSRIVIDYIQGSALRDFYKHPVSLDGIRQSITDRNAFPTDRKLLVEQLQNQYSSLPVSEKVNQNINALLNRNAYTICTAHQPNIFTGHLYFIYKIIHVIKLAVQLNEQLAGNTFVPVFYIGSEDADLDELGHIFLSGKKYEWKTKQRGAVGRMIVDNDLIKMIETISGQISVLPFGKKIMNTIKDCYTKGAAIETATFKLLHTLFSDYGLIVLMPDNPALKKVMLQVFENDLFTNEPSRIVNESSAALEKEYAAQAHARDINLFYLIDNVRNRIIRHKDSFRVDDTDITFTDDEIRDELKEHPERFSPNVILRGLYQETILPDVAFIGGGGELAYWLELKSLFDSYKVPFPMLVLRNSFVYIEEKVALLMEKNSVSPQDIFKGIPELMKDIVKKHSPELSLSEEKGKIIKLYQEIQNTASAVDPTLHDHVTSLLAKVSKTIEALEKKMYKAERRKFDSEEGQLIKIYSYLFPNNNLQERVDNFLPFYAKYGEAFFHEIYEASFGLEQKLVIVIKK